MNFQIGDHVICVNRKVKDHLKVGNVRVVQAFNHKIKVCFEDGTESKLQAANNFEHFEDGKRKRGQGEEDDNKEENEKEDDIPLLIDSDEENENCDQLRAVCA